jgi:hypothetical protein
MDKKNIDDMSDTGVTVLVVVTDGVVRVIGRYVFHGIHFC